MTKVLLNKANLSHHQNITKGKQTYNFIAKTTSIVALNGLFSEHIDGRTKGTGIVPRSH
jgi:hypothetical protein